MSRKYNGKLKRDMIDAASRFAQADRSDPFAMARAITHMKNGIASPSNDKGQVAYYDAEQIVEHREFTHDGRTVKYTVPAFIGLVRP